MDKDEFRRRFFDLMDYRDNPYHPLVWINGEPEIGARTYIGGFTDINAKGAELIIGADCDIASFVAINVADSHRVALEIADGPDCRDIHIGDHVFIGSHSAVLGGSRIGHHSVIGAGTVLRGEEVPPFSLVIGNPAEVKPGYYRAAFEDAQKKKSASS